MAKNLILDPILACLIQIWTLGIFLQLLPLLVVAQYSKLSSYTISRKTNEPNMKNLKNFFRFYLY